MISHITNTPPATKQRPHLLTSENMTPQCLLKTLSKYSPSSLQIQTDVTGIDHFDSSYTEFLLGNESVPHNLLMSETGMDDSHLNPEDDQNQIAHVDQVILNHDLLNSGISNGEKWCDSDMMDLSHIGTLHQSNVFYTNEIAQQEKNLNYNSKTVPLH